MARTNQPATKATATSRRTLSLRSLRLCGEYLQLKEFLDIGHLGKAITQGVVCLLWSGEWDLLLLQLEFCCTDIALRPVIPQKRICFPEIFKDLEVKSGRFAPDLGVFFPIRNEKSELVKAKIYTFSSGGKVGGQDLPVILPPDQGVDVDFLTFGLLLDQVWKEFNGLNDLFLVKLDSGDG